MKTINWAGAGSTSIDLADAWGFYAAITPYPAFTQTESRLVHAAAKWNHHCRENSFRFPQVTRMW
ncbi:MAG: hypothetical protein ACPHJ3_21105 [Rubripirellula sp.]